MIFEASFKSTIVDSRGNDKVITLSYILEDKESFSEVETELYEEFGNMTGFEVAAIKISKLREIVNERPQSEMECKIYFATIVDKFYDAEKDETKETKYTVALFAADIDEAHKSVSQYMSQGFEDMELKQLKETKYIDVIR